MTAVFKSSQGFSLAAQVKNLQKNFFYRTAEVLTSPSADDQPLGLMPAELAVLCGSVHMTPLASYTENSGAVVSEGWDKLHAQKILETQY